MRGQPLPVKFVTLRDAIRYGRSQWVPSIDKLVTDEQTMSVQLVIAPDTSSPMRLVLLTSDSRPFEIDAFSNELDRFVRHAELARRLSERRSIGPGVTSFLPDCFRKSLPARVA